MKLKILATLFLSIILFLGCQKWKEPEFKAEDWIKPPDSEARQYWINSKNVIGKHTPGTPPDSLVKYNDTYLRYIRAVVVSSDEGGNYYKSMVVQDSTGGVELQLDMPGLYNFYPVGQKIVLLCKGLVIGDYNYLPQIGWIYNGNQVGRIHSLFIDKYIIKDGLPSLKNLPKPLTNDEIDFSIQNNANKDINKLVRLESVTFQDIAIGKPIAFNDFITEWKIYVPLANGNKQEVTVRTSNFAKFRNMIIEEKKYNLTGILTLYRSTFQFMIRTKEDIETVSDITFDFTTNPLGEGKWNNQSLLGNTQWIFRNYSMFHAGNQAYQAYQTAMDDWLISPVITVPDFNKGNLYIEHQLPVSNAVSDAYWVYYTTSTSTTFNASEWKQLGKIDHYPPLFAWSNKLPLSSIGANTFRIAFRYKAPDKNIETYNWSIKKVEIR